MSKKVISSIALVLVFILLFAGCLKMCSSPKLTVDVSNTKDAVVATSNENPRFILRKLPKGIDIAIVDEDHDPIDGKYSLKFTITNNTGKVLRMPAFSGDLYVDGEIKGPADGGADHELQKGETAPAHFNWIIAKGMPDSVVFNYVGFEIK